METPIDIIRRAVETERFDEEGDLIQLDLLPPLADDDLDATERDQPSVGAFGRRRQARRGRRHTAAQSGTSWLRDGIVRIDG
jgi:hypothetical protein